MPPKTLPSSEPPRRSSRTLTTKSATVDEPDSPPGGRAAATRAPRYSLSRTAKASPKGEKSPDSSPESNKTTKRQRSRSITSKMVAASHSDDDSPAPRTSVKRQKEEDPGTPTTPELEQMVRDEELAQIKSNGVVKEWLTDGFLRHAFDHKLFPVSSRTYPPNPKPTFYVLAGPPGTGKTNVKTLFPEMHGVINIDVDDIKLHGSDVLGVNIEGKRIIEGIQFKYPNVLAKLRPYVFEAAKAGGVGHYKNIILDTTGSMRPIIKKYVDTAKRDGYNIEVIIVFSRQEQCLERVTSRNSGLVKSGHQTRVMPLFVVKSEYANFVKKRNAVYYALHPSLLRRTDKLTLVDNQGSSKPYIVATRTQDKSGECRFETFGKDAAAGAAADSQHLRLLDVPEAFYGLTITTTPPNITDKPSEGGGRLTRKRRFTQRILKKKNNKSRSRRRLRSN